MLCGPSGAGKSTLVGKLMKEFEGQFGFSVSHTTRNPREGEVDGVHYHFVSKEDMQRDIDAVLILRIPPLPRRPTSRTPLPSLSPCLL